MTLFDVIDCLNNKKYVWDEDVEKLYEPWMINRGFSNFSDAILFAAEMNQYQDLDKKMQYDFYYHFLPKKKRFAKWEKALKQSEDETLLVSLFDVSREKTAEMIKTLDAVEPDWRTEAKSRLERGGRTRSK